MYVQCLLVDPKKWEGQWIYLSVFLVGYRLDLRMNYVTRVNTVMGVVKKEISSMDGKLLWSTNGLKQKASYSKESAAHCTKSVL